MKTTIYQVMNTVLVILLIAGPAVYGQSTAMSNESVDNNPFEMGMYMGADWTVNLMLAVKQPQGVTVRVRNADDAVVCEQYLKQSRTTYHQKIKFEGSKAGVYRLEITDGRQTIVRRVEIIDVPAIQAQRYMTYNTPSDL